MSSSFLKETTRKLSFLIYIAQQNIMTYSIRYNSEKIKLFRQKKLREKKNICEIHLKNEQICVILGLMVQIRSIIGFSAI